jgi:hypothetical protein
MEDGHEIGDHMKRSYFDAGIPEYEVKLINRRLIQREELKSTLIDFDIPG